MPEITPYVIPYENIAPIPWNGDNNTYDQIIYKNFCKKDQVSIALNPWTRHKDAFQFITSVGNADSKVCTVYYFEDEWVAKIFPPKWKEGRYISKRVVKPLLTWKRNTEVPLEIDFENPIYELAAEDQYHEMVWYVEPEFVDGSDSTWLYKCSPKGQKINGVRKMGFLTPKNIDKYFDVIFISYNEPNADKNWTRVLEKASWAKRVNGVKGIYNAHKVAAELAETDMFWVVDGDAEVLDYLLNVRGITQEVIDRQKIGIKEKELNLQSNFSVLIGVNLLMISVGNRSMVKHTSIVPMFKIKK